MTTPHTTTFRASRERPNSLSPNCCTPRFLWLALALLATAIHASAAPVLPTRGNVQEFDTVVQLLASSPQQITTTYVCKGISAINDGAGGRFYYLANDTTATNSTDCFAWSAGRLRRNVDALTASRLVVQGSSSGTNYIDKLSINLQVLDPRNFGTIDTTGVGDSYAAMQACINEASDGTIIELPEGTIYCSQSLHIPGNAFPPIYRDWITIRGRGMFSTIITGDDEDYPVIDAAGASHVRLADLTIWGLNNKPSCGLLVGRVAGDASAGEHVFDQVRIVGNFKIASYFGLSSEVISHNNCFYTTDSPLGAPSVVVLADHAWSGIQSRYSVLGTGAGGNTVHKFDNCVITCNLTSSTNAAGLGASLLVAEYAMAVNLQNVTFASQGITNQVLLKKLTEGYTEQNCRHEYTVTAEPTGMRLEYDLVTLEGFFYGLSFVGNRNLPIYGDTGSWLANSKIGPTTWYSANCSASPYIANLWNMDSVEFKFYGKSNEIVVAGCLTNAIVNTRGTVVRNNWTRELFESDSLNVVFTNTLDVGNFNVNTNARVQAYLTVGSANQTEADIGAVRADASEIMLEVPDRKWYIQVIDSGAGGDSSVQFRNMTGSVDAFRIFPTGNVGIQSGFLGIGLGTAAPTNPIDISFASTSTISLEATAAGGQEWLVQTGDNVSGLNGGFRIYNNSLGLTGLSLSSSGQATFSGPVVLASYTKVQKAALTPVNGMVVYQTDNTPGLRAYINGAWYILSTAADP